MNISFIVLMEGTLVLGYCFVFDAFHSVIYVINVDMITFVEYFYNLRFQ